LGGKSTRIATKRIWDKGKTVWDKNPRGRDRNPGTKTGEKRKGFRGGKRVPSKDVQKEKVRWNG